MAASQALATGGEPQTQSGKSYPLVGSPMGIENMPIDEWVSLIVGPVGE